MIDDDLIKLVGRFILSFFILYLVYNGQMSGMVGATSATIISGVDVAAFVEAVRIVKAEDGETNPQRNS